MRTQVWLSRTHILNSWVLWCVLINPSVGKVKAGGLLGLLARQTNPKLVSDPISKEQDGWLLRNGTQGWPRLVSICISTNLHMYFMFLYTCKPTHTEKRNLDSGVYCKIVIDYIWYSRSTMQFPFFPGLVVQIMWHQVMQMWHFGLVEHCSSTLFLHSICTSQNTIWQLHCIALDS